MSLFAVSLLACMGLGPTMAGWVEASPSLGWRWIHWVNAMCGVIPFRLIVVLTVILVPAEGLLSLCLYS
jgi:hypothetical protein